MKFQNWTFHFFSVGKPTQRLNEVQGLEGATRVNYGGRTVAKTKKAAKKKAAKKVAKKAAKPAAKKATKKKAAKRK